MEEYKTKWQILDQLAENEKKTRRVEIEGKDGKVQFVGGALGEIEGCNAFVEETRKDPIWRTKYFGVSYWYKGITDNEIINQVTIVKRVFREGIRLLVNNKYLLPLILIFKDNFIKSALEAMRCVYDTEGGLKSKCLKSEEFCPACQELIKAGIISAKGNEEMKDLIYCLAMFLQFSPTYRYYLQDILGQVDKELLRKSPLLAILRLRNTFFRRLNKRKQKRGKMSFLGNTFSFIGYIKEKAD